MKELTVNPLDLFPTRCWIVDIGILDAGAYDKFETFESRTASNRGGRQYACEWTDLPELHSAASDITNAVFAGKTSLGNCWVNFNGPGDYNIQHVHPRSAFSGVYWHAVPEGSAPIRFRRFDDFPIASFYGEHATDSWSSSVSTVSPRAGTMIIFPSWLPHWVDEGTNTEDRISVAFNLST